MEIIGVFAKENDKMDFKSLRPYVRQALEQKVKAPAELPIRWLVAYQIAITTEGEAVMHLDDVSHNMTKGSVAFIPPNVAHRYTVTSDHSKLVVVFDTNYSEISRNRNISSSLPPETLPSHRKAYLQENIYKNYSLPYIFTPDNFDDYLNCWYEIKEAIKKNNSYAAELRMTNLLNLIHDELGITNIKDKIDYCEAVKDYIDAGFERIITLEEIALLYEINKFTISKKFKTRYGTSIIAYYNEKRLAYAKAELSKPEASVTRISEYLNFTDVYTFSKFFKIHTGMAPRTYKAACLKENKQK